MNSRLKCWTPARKTTDNVTTLARLGSTTGSPKQTDLFPKDPTIRKARVCPGKKGSGPVFSWYACVAPGEGRSPCALAGSFLHVPGGRGK